MTELQVRRPRFNFGDADVPFAWNPENPQFSFFMNATSMIAIGFEQMIVAAVQEARPLITDPAVLAEATAFLKQEAQHSSSHRKHVAALITHYPGLQETFDAVNAAFDEVTASTPLNFRLAYIADLEATFTPAFKLMLDNERTLFRPGDDRVASLFLWHFVEEVEHRSSALVIYDAVVSDRWYRMRALPATLRHLVQVSRTLTEGVNRHVPLQDRGVDARTFVPADRVRLALRQRFSPDSEPIPKSVPAFHSVPWREKLASVGRVMLSQTPFHDPNHQPLPRFAERWFRRYDEGADVTRWYAAERAG